MEEVWKDISLSLSPIFSNHQNSLNFQDFFPIQKTNKQQKQPINHNGLFSGEAPATVLSLGTGAPAKKRVLVVDGSNEEEKSKRLMKNRESADKARARKQAHTMELEKEVTRLKKENATLKGQLKMSSSEGYEQLPKKRTLHRTLSAPF